MSSQVNPGKRDVIEVGGRHWSRRVIPTHFVEVGESYLELAERYAAPELAPGDILAISEKVIALCQGRVIYEEEMQVGFLARLLARFVHQTQAGPGVGLPIKMQFAIDQRGKMFILYAALRAGWDKLRGIHGTFYRMAGPEARGLDGFYGRDIPAYAHIGIRIPREPDRVCDQISRRLGVPCVIVDANGLGVEVLGRSGALLEQPVRLFQDILRDNPAGQEGQLTPFVRIRQVPAPVKNKT